MGVYSEMAADLRDNVQDRSPAIQDAAELASRRADDRQQAEEEQAKALLSQMQQNADDSPSPSNLKADKRRKRIVSGRSMSRLRPSGKPSGRPGSEPRRKLNRPHGKTR